jgi:hypothetical protein
MTKRIDLHGLLCLVLASALASAGCGGGDDDDAKSSGKGTGGDHGGAAGEGASGSSGDGSDAGGSGTTDEKCMDDSTELQPAVDRLIGNLALDADAIYVSQTASAEDDQGIFRLPKTGGQAKRIAQIDYLAGGGPIAIDGDYVYYGDGDGNLDRIKKDGSGSPEMLSEVVGNLYSIAVDDGGVYFVDGLLCCESLGNDTTKFIRRYDKASGEITQVASAAGIESVVPAGGFVYWIGHIEKNESDKVLSTPPQSLFKTPSAGGDSVVLFASKDDSGPNPGSGLGDGVVLDGSAVIFGSLDLDRFDATGIYRIAQDAKMGMPTLINDELSLNQGFVNGSGVYTNNGVGIVRVSLDDGSTKTVACGGMKSPITNMAHDDARIYYVRFNEANEQAIRSATLKD